MLLVSVPIQVVAREEKTVLKKQNTMPLRVSRRGDGEESRSQFPRAFAVKDAFRTGLRRQLIPMNDASALEMFGKTLGIGHVVSMCQEDVGDAANRLQLLHERRDELRRVNQPIACWVSNEVTVAAIRFGRVVSAVIDRLPSLRITPAAILVVVLSSGPYKATV